MKNIRLLILPLIAILVGGCGGSKQARTPLRSTVQTVEVEYNALVESFTSGMIGRRSPVEINLTKPLPPGTDPDKYIRISPKVKGKWSVKPDNSRMLVFEAADGFQRGETYKVDFSLRKVFPDDPEANDFSFRFRVLPSAASARMTAFVCESDGSYTVKGVMQTADFEDSVRVREITRWSETGSGVKWSHSADGRRHGFTISGIPGTGKERNLTLSVQDRKSGYDQANALQVLIPDGKSFKVHSVEYFGDSEKYIEVRFTQPLSSRQDLDGLLWLEDVSTVMRTDGNRVLIYPRDSQRQEVDLYVDAALKSESGNSLEQDFALKVQTGSERPAAQFIGKSTILPPSYAMAGSGGRGVPFRAVNLRAVRVDVLRVSEQMMIHYLQTEELDEHSNYGLMRTARPVATKTIFLDELGDPVPGQWSAYSLDLDDLIKPEPGALYRIILTYDRSMASLPCIDASEHLTPEQAAVADRERLENMQRQFDKGGYYWSPTSRDWDNYNWRDREDPCTPSYYYNRDVQRNLLVTDLGVIVKASDEPEMVVLVNSITSVQPVSNATIELYNYQGLKIGSGSTKNDGEAHIKLQNGRPYYIKVSKGSERTYMKVGSGMELSTSGFPVSGEQVQQGLRGFIWTERGVWRPGDTIFMNFVTTGHRLPERHPVSVELRTPLGQLYQKRMATHNVDGIYSFVLVTDPNAPTGVWNAEVTVGGASFGKRLRIEAVKPNRLKIDMQVPDDMIRRGEPMNARLHGEWLTGAQAGNLKYVIETQFAGVRTTFPGHDGYVFNNQYNTYTPTPAPDITGTTDAQGDALVTTVVKGGEKAGGMLRAFLTTRLFEPSGEASVDAMQVYYSPYDAYVGIRPPDKSDRQLDTDKEHTFDLTVVDPSGKTLGRRNIEVVAYRLQWYWWWNSSRNDVASYIAYQELDPYDSETIRTDNSGKGEYKIKVGKREWGTYYIAARDRESGHESAVMVYIDWPYGSRSGDDAPGAMRLTVSMDKESYEVGEKATITFPSAKGSRAIISLENGSRVVQTMGVECSEGQTRHSFEVTPEMQPNVYANVTLLQPHGNVENDLPVRLYGIVPLMVSSGASKLQPVVKAPDEVLPESRLSFTVSEQKGRPMAYTLVMVDEGLLDLTRFRTPDPWAAFNARVALGVSTWDIYNYVLGAYGGKIEQMFAIGGDDELLDPEKASVNRFPPVVKYLGIFRLEKGKTNTHQVDLPAYMGRVRIMAVAVSPDADDGNGAWGSAEKSVAVRAPLMMLGTAPRVVAPGDEIIVPATLLATQDGIGSIKVNIETDDAFTVVGSAIQETALNTTGDKVVYFRLKVRDEARGGGKITLTANGNGKTAKYSMEIPVRDLSTPVMFGQSHTVAPGQTWERNIAMEGIAGTRKLMLEVSALQPMNASQRTHFLSTYPYGCIEQITSGGFPFLYLPQLTELTEKERENVDSKVRSVLNRYKQYVVPDGSMGYWPGSAEPHMWGSVYALHFMTVAGHKGYELPTALYGRLKSVVRTTASSWNASQNTSLNLVQAYRLYVLALAGEPELGAMNRLRQSGKMSRNTQVMLSAAYAAAGRNDIGRTVIQATDSLTSNDIRWNEEAYTYSSPERSESMELLAATLLGMSGDAARVAERVSRSLSSERWMSTQSTAWSMLSLGEYVTRSGQTGTLDFDWTAGSESGKVSGEGKPFWTAEWDEPASGKMTVTNRTQATLYIRSVGSWVSPAGITPSTSNGVTVEVRYLNEQGREVDITDMNRGTDFMAEVTIRNASQDPYRDLMLSMPVPSGWEILPSNNNTPLPTGFTYRDIRDDRVDAYIPQLPARRSVMIRVRMNATYGGSYILPAVKCEAMYDAKITANTASQAIRINN